MLEVRLAIQRIALDRFSIRLRQAQAHFLSETRKAGRMEPHWAQVVQPVKAQFSTLLCISLPGVVLGAEGRVQLGR
jgi:hypothetical protein